MSKRTRTTKGVVKKEDVIAEVVSSGGGGGADSSASSSSSSKKRTKNQREFEDLKNILLSPVTSTEVDDASSSLGDTIVPKSDAEVLALFQSSVDNFDSMLDRTETRPISEYILCTYKAGLPIYESNPQVQQHTILALRFIVDTVTKMTPPERKIHLTKLAEAYQACQAVQGRVIDSVYGSLSGRDTSLRGHLLTILDEEKQRTLDEMTHALHPKAMLASDDFPQQQFPHIQNAYRFELGEQLGLRGVKAASVDHCKPELKKTEIKKAETKFWELFRVEDFADVIVADVNQPNSAPGGRKVPRTLLSSWAGEQSASGFDAHSIFYDEEKASEYNGKPAQDEMYEPFLNRKVAISILCQVFLQ